MFLKPVCRHCDYRPCAVDALVCPRCAKMNPNPGLMARLGSLIAAPILAGLIFVFGFYISRELHGGWLAVVGVGTLALGVFLGGAWHAFDPGFASFRRSRQRAQ